MYETATASKKKMNIKPSDDISCNVRSSRADKIRHLFIQVHASRQYFISENKYEAVVAVSHQAADRLYEVVIVDTESVTVLVRFYVFEDELDDQMQKRHELLTRIYGDPLRISGIISTVSDNNNDMPATSNESSTRSWEQGYESRSMNSSCYDNDVDLEARRARVIHEDISASKTQNISHYISVILKSLHRTHSEGLDDVTFRLFDGGSTCLHVIDFC